MARKIGFKLSDEAQAKVKIVAGQCMTTEDEVVEAAIELVYRLAPEDRNQRTSIMEIITRAQAG